jgi:hypothetical protein
MPHFEKVTQIKADYPVSTATGGQNRGLTMKEKSGYKAGSFTLSKDRREKKAIILNECTQTTGYNRKYRPAYS